MYYACSPSYYLKILRCCLVERHTTNNSRKTVSLVLNRLRLSKNLLHQTLLPSNIYTHGFEWQQYHFPKVIPRIRPRALKQRIRLFGPPCILPFAPVASHALQWLM